MVCCLVFIGKVQGRWELTLELRLCPLPNCSCAITAVPVLKFEADPAGCKSAAGNGLGADCSGIEQMAITIKAGTNLPDGKAFAQASVPFGGWIDDFDPWNFVEFTKAVDSPQRPGPLYIKVADTRGALPKTGRCRALP